MPIDQINSTLQALVVEGLNSASQRINATKTHYPMDSAIRPLNNWGQRVVYVFLFFFLFHSVNQRLKLEISIKDNES